MGQRHPRPLSTPGKDPVPIVQETGWATGAGLETCGKSRPHRIRSPDRPALIQSLYRLSYPVRFFQTLHFIQCDQPRGLLVSVSDY
jgi:hypothetical protein